MCNIALISLPRLVRTCDKTGDLSRATNEYLPLLDLKLLATEMPSHLNLFDSFTPYYA